MHKIDTINSADTLLAAGDAGPNPNGFFKDHTFDEPGTRLDSAFLNSVQEELANVIIQSGAALDKADNTQLYNAINAIIANGPANGFYLDTDLDVLGHSLINTGTSDFYFNLSGSLTLDCTNINVGTALTVGGGPAITNFINENTLASDSAAAIPTMKSLASYVNTKIALGNQYVLVRGYTRQAINAGDTKSFSMGDLHTAATDDPVYSFVVPYSGIVMDLAVRWIVGSTGSSVGNTTFTLLKNNVATTITGTAATDTGVYNNTGGTYVAVSAGDRIKLQAAITGGDQKYLSQTYFHFKLYPLSAPP